MPWIRPHRRGRPPHPDVLTPAEWRVLELVREGLSNGDVATRLGITIPTVKTHMSRILAKTESRDRNELLKWEGQPAVSAGIVLRRAILAPFSGWFMTSAKVAVGVFVAAAGVGAILLTYAALNGARGGSGADAPTLLVGYYMESEYDLGALGDRSQPPGRHLTGIARTWAVNDQRWRIESEVHSPVGVFGANSTVVVPVGDRLRIYDQLRDTYTYLPQADGTEDPIRSLLGPAPADTVDDAILQWSAEFGTRGARAGTDNLLGRVVDVIEFRGHPAAGMTRRLSIDPSTMFVLRDEVDGASAGTTRLFSVTRFEPSTGIAPSWLDFSPPVTAEERVSQRDVETGSFGCFDSPASSNELIATHPGLLRLTAVPTGWLAGGSGVGTSTSCEVVDAWGILARSDGSSGFLLFEQSIMLDGIPSRLREGTRINVTGFDGYRQSDGEIERLTWSRDGIVAVLESDVLSADDLLSVAESAELVPNPP